MGKCGGVAGEGGGIRRGGEKRIPVGAGRPYVAPSRPTSCKQLQTVEGREINVKRASFMCNFCRVVLIVFAPSEKGALYIYDISI